MKSFEQITTLPTRETVEEKVEEVSQEQKERDLLLEQFEHPGKVEVYGGEMEVVDINPEQPKTETPTVFLGGYLTSTESNKGAILKLAGSQRRTLSINEPHGIEPENIHEATEIENKMIPNIEFRKVAALLKMIDEKGLDQVDLVAHSEGAIYGAWAAILRPERIRNIVLVDPAGMIGEDSASRIIKGTAVDIAIQTSRIWKKIKENPEEGKEAKRRADQVGKEALKSFAKDPKRSIEAIGAITDSQIEDLLLQIRELGIHISIIHGVDDKYFSMDRVQKVTKEPMIDGFYSVQGTHNDIAHYPEKYAGLVDKALDALEVLSLKEKLNEEGQEGSEQPEQEELAQAS